MIIFPAMDLKDGKCVRLYQGKFDKTEVVGENPLDVAKRFKEDGAEYLHVVDLDGALNGKPSNIDVVLRVLEKIKLPIELGGGIRDLKTIDFLIEKGVKRIILGTSALNNPDIVRKAVKKYSDKIAVGIDAKNGFVAVDGWVKVSNINYIDFAKLMEDIGVGTIIFTDISKDGTLQGPNLEQLGSIQQSVSCNIIASGGIKSIDDLKAIKDMGIYGAITGKTIYSGNINLKEAIEVCK